MAQVAAIEKKNIQLRKRAGAMADHYNVLFVCTGNSARSIMAEAILNNKGDSGFTAYSAGSRPTGRVRPEAIRQLESVGLPTANLRCKRRAEFDTPGAPQMDFVFTVCDTAANEVCPVWPGKPVTGHWGVPDPAAVFGVEQEVEKAYREVFLILERRISLFLCLPHSSLDRIAIQGRVDEIGKR